MKNTLTLIDTVILGSGSEENELPAELRRDIPVLTAEETNLPGFLAAVTSAQEKGYVLIVTHSHDIAQICRSLNLHFSHHKLAVMENSTLDAAELEMEMEQMLLHTEDGADYLPLPAAHPVLYQSDDRALLRGQMQAAGRALFTHDGKQWGTLLPETIHASNYCGTLTEMIPVLTETEKASVLTSVTKGGTCSTPDNILLFSEGGAYPAICLQDSPQMSAAELELLVLTGLKVSAPPAEILTALSKLYNIKAAIRLAETYCSHAVFS